MEVKDLMSSSIVCVRPETSLSQVAKQMRQADIGSIPVCDDQSQVH